MVKNKKNRGYMLAETIVYVTIVAILFFVVSFTLVALIKVYAESRATRALQENGLTSIERMGREIQRAKSVTVWSPTEVSTVIEIGGSDTTIILWKNGNALFISSDEGSGPLTGSDTVVTNLLFRKSVSGGIEMVKIELTLQAKDKTETFYTSVIARGTYAD
jgi:type II secretory pathway pseudopilin PulG